MKSIALARSDDDLARAVKACGIKLILLTPGKYTAPGISLNTSLLGIGDVTVTASARGHGHAALIVDENAAVDLANLKLCGNGDRVSVALCHPLSQVRMFDCRVENCEGGGVLVAGGSALIKRCVFSRCFNLAIEVRQGGSLECVETTVDGCRKGVCAYGGARRVSLHRCSILRSKTEGVMAMGTFENAATVLQMETSGVRSGAKNDAALAAEKWSKAHNVQLELKMTECVVSESGSIGVSIGQGACAELTLCRLENNDPHNLLIKDGSDCLSCACQYVFKDPQLNKSAFAVMSKSAIDQSGIEVGINYNGDVVLLKNSFAGPSKFAICEHGGVAEAAHYLKKGMWSRPATIKESMFYAKASDMPTLEELSLSLPTLAPKRDIRRPEVSLQPSHLRRICSTFQQPSWAPTAAKYYAIGNTFGFDVSYDLLKGTSASVLLIGCGDVRNVLATAVLATRADNRIEFILNDGNISIIARNAVMLHMAVELQASAEDVLAVWANHALTEEQCEMLRNSCTELAEKPWPSWLQASTSLGLRATLPDAAAEIAIRSACRAWAHCSLTLPMLLDRRQARLRESKEEALKLTVKAVGETKAPTISELKKYVQTGSLSLDGTRPNVTLLVAPELQYNLYFSSSIFRALPMAQATDKDTDVTSRLLLTLRPQLECLVSGLRDSRFKVIMSPGEALAELTSAGPDAKFDFIYCSNVADYVSIPALLQACQPLLTKTLHARVVLESIVQMGAWALQTGLHSALEFLDASVGMPHQTYMLLLGMRIANTSQTGSLLRVEFARSLGFETPDFSAGWLLKELKPMFDRMVGQAANKLDTVASMSHCSCVFRGAPLTFAHLLSILVPRADITAFTNAFLSDTSVNSAKLFKWELQHAANAQSGRASQMARVTLDALPGMKVLRHIAHPFFVAFSKTPLNGITSLSSVMQLFSSFDWNDEFGRASFILQESLILKCKPMNLYVTLCSLGTEGLDAMGRSQELSTLRTEPIDVQPWISAAPRFPELDCTALATGQGSWRSVVRYGLQHV